MRKFEITVYTNERCLEYDDGDGKLKGVISIKRELKDNSTAQFLLDTLCEALNSIERAKQPSTICQHHKRHEQCVWGLRGCCKDSPCEINYNLRKK
jgi:hypothetical protein